jgi:hypothetical protein
MRLRVKSRNDRDTRLLSISVAVYCLCSKKNYANY